MNDRFIEYMTNAISEMERSTTDWFTVTYAPIYRTILANYRTIISTPIDVFDNDNVGTN